MNTFDDIKRKLYEDLNRLDRELRVELPKEIGRALAMGDLRENAEYKAALERQEHVKGRIGLLQKRLSELSIVDISRIPKDRAAFGSTLHLSDLDSGETKVYRLSMPEESDLEKGWVSTVSPIGKALMGHRDGDEVEIRTPSGTKRYEITRLITLFDEQTG